MSEPVPTMVPGGRAERSGDGRFVRADPRCVECERRRAV